MNAHDYVTNIDSYSMIYCCDAIVILYQQWLIINNLFEEINTTVDEQRQFIETQNQLDKIWYFYE